MPRILVLMSETGGGHRASAEALQAAFAERYGPAFQVQIVDPWSHHTPWPIHHLPRIYGPMVQHTPWLWKALWVLGERNWIARPVLALMGLLTQRSLLRLYQAQAPDLVICVHPLVQHPALRALRRYDPRVPFVTVVTDLASVSATWFHAGVSRCLVPTSEARQKAISQGLAPDQVEIVGLPVRPAFARPLPDRTRLRAERGLAPERCTVLLMGGGEGVGPMEAMATALAERLDADRRPAQMVVICGRNRRLRRRLLERAWPLPVHVQGFVEDMPGWMAAADVIVTKAGPGTIAESLICGLPLVLFSYIPGQEEGNVAYVEEQGVGVYLPEPGEVAAQVSYWFGPGRAQREAMALRARDLGRPQATFQIVEQAAGLLMSAPISP